MQAVLEFVPWIIFFFVYKFGGGIFPATAALMGAMALLLIYVWSTTRKLPQMLLVVSIFVWVFGAITLILHDVRFLQWKASVIYWILGLAIGGAAFIGRTTLLERMLGKALPEGATLPQSDWRIGSVIMGLFYLLLGFINLWVAFNRSESDWVTFKAWIAAPLAVIFTLGIALWLLRAHLFAKDPPS